MKQTFFHLWIVFAICFLSSCTNRAKEYGASSHKEQAISERDTLLRAQEDAIIGLLQQKLDNSSIGKISLTTKAEDIKTAYRIRPLVTGSTHSQIAYGRFYDKRMTWGLSIVTDEPFGKHPEATPRQVILEISLSEQAAKNKKEIVQHIAEYLQTQPETWKTCQGYWMLVSCKGNSIFITISDTQSSEPEEETDDANTFDFT